MHRLQGLFEVPVVSVVAVSVLPQQPLRKFVAYGEHRAVQHHHIVIRQREHQFRELLRDYIAAVNIIFEGLRVAEDDLVATLDVAQQLLQIAFRWTSVEIHQQKKVYVGALHNLEE